MSETTKHKYTLETLLPLNVSYDRDHILRQQDVELLYVRLSFVKIHSRRSHIARYAPLP